MDENNNNNDNNNNKDNNNSNNNNNNNSVSLFPGVAMLSMRAHKRIKKQRSNSSKIEDRNDQDN